MIEARDAHIWWLDHPKLVAVVSFGEQPPFRRHDGLKDGGASYARWREEYTDAERVREMMEMVVELLFNGHKPDLVLWEFAKVRQFRQLGAESFPMCRVLSRALEGRSHEDCDLFRELYSRDARMACGVEE